MKRHGEVVGLLAVYRNLDPASRALVDQHVLECPACAARQTAYAQMDQALAGLVDPRPGAALPRSLNGILHGRSSRWVPARPVPQQARVAPKVLVAAAVLALIVVSFWIVLRVLPPTGPVLAETPSVTPTSTSLAAVLTPPYAFAPDTASQAARDLAFVSTPVATRGLDPIAAVAAMP